MGTLTAILAFDSTLCLSHFGTRTCIETSKGDKQRFKQFTTNCDYCIVGARTFIHDFKSKELPNRKFLVYGKDFLSKSEILEKVQDTNSYIIGGMVTYNDFIEHTDYINYSYLPNRGLNALGSPVLHIRNYQLSDLIFEDLEILLKQGSNPRRVSRDFTGSGADFACHNELRVNLPEVIG